MGCSAIGALSKLAVQGGSTPRTFANTSERHAFISANIQPIHSWSGFQWGLGEIAPTRAGSRRKLTLYGGTIILEGSRQNFTKWLPRAVWSTAGSSPYDVGLDPSNHWFDMLFYTESGTIRFSDCLVNSFTAFSDVNTSLCYIALSVVAMTKSTATSWPSPEPSLPSTDAYVPFTHYESALTVNSVDIPFEQLFFQVDNKLFPVANTSQVTQKFRTQGRETFISAVCPFDTSAWPEIDYVLDGSSDGQLKWDGGSLGSVTLDLQNFQNIKHTAPSIQGKESINVAFQLRANKDDASTPEMAITIAS